MLMLIYSYWYNNIDKKIVVQGIVYISGALITTGMYLLFSSKGMYT